MARLRPRAGAVHPAAGLFVEEIFGWMKAVGGFRRTRYRGAERTQLAGYLVAAAYNLVRMARLIPGPATG